MPPSFYLILKVNIQQAISFIYLISKATLDDGQPLVVYKMESAFTGCLLCIIRIQIYYYYKKQHSFHLSCIKLFKVLNIGYLVFL